MFIEQIIFVIIWISGFLLIILYGNNDEKIAKQEVEYSKFLIKKEKLSKKGEFPVDLVAPPDEIGIGFAIFCSLIFAMIFGFPLIAILQLMKII